jgi:hypothetical protein
MGSLFFEHLFFNMGSLRMPTKVIGPAAEPIHVTFQPPRKTPMPVTDTNN